MLVTGIVPGALPSGNLRWQWVPDLWASAFGSNPLLRVVVALLDGIVLGFGALVQRLYQRSWHQWDHAAGCIKLDFSRQLFRRGHSLNSKPANS